MSDKKYYLVDHEEVGGLRYGVLESDKPGSQLSWQHGHPNHGTLAMRRLIRDDDNVHVGTDLELVEVGSARDHEETERAKWIRNEGEPKGEDAGQFYVVSSKPGAPLNYAIRGLVAGGVYWSDKPPLRDSRYFFKSEREAEKSVVAVSDEQKAPATKRKPRTPEEFKAHLAAIKRLKRAVW